MHPEEPHNVIVTIKIELVPNFSVATSTSDFDECVQAQTRCVKSKRQKPSSLVTEDDVCVLSTCNNQEEEGSQKRSVKSVKEKPKSLITEDDTEMKSLTFCQADLAAPSSETIQSAGAQAVLKQLFRIDFKDVGEDSQRRFMKPTRRRTIDSIYDDEIESLNPTNTSRRLPPVEEPEVDRYNDLHESFERITHPFKMIVYHK